MSRSRSRLAADWFANLTANAVTGEVEGASVIKGTSLPSPISEEGTLFYDTVADALYVSKGTSWAILTNPPPVPTGGTVILITTTESAGTFDYNLGLDFADADDADNVLTYSLVSGTMPGGCTLPTGGNTAFTGTATSVATNTIYTWVIGATDTAGGMATQAYQQQVNTVVPSATGGTITITADGVAGFASSYDSSAQFTYATGSAESSYAISAGTLPTGLTLNTATGVISGTNGANGAAGPAGPQGLAGLPGPAGADGAANRAVVTAVIDNNGSAIELLPAGAGNDPLKPPNMATYIAQNPFTDPAIWQSFSSPTASAATFSSGA